MMGRGTVQERVESCFVLTHLDFLAIYSPHDKQCEQAPRRRTEASRKLINSSAGYMS